MAETATRIEQATVADTPAVVALVGKLLVELGGFTAFDATDAAALCERLLATDRYTALLARDEQGQALGVLTLQECSALYVAGAVGLIQELYVTPAARSHGVGHQLLKWAVDYGRSMGGAAWKSIPLRPPSGPAPSPSTGVRGLPAAPSICASRSHKDHTVISAGTLPKPAGRRALA